MMFLLLRKHSGIIMLEDIVTSSDEGPAGESLCCKPLCWPFSIQLEYTTSRVSCNGESCLVKIQNKQTNK